MSPQLASGIWGIALLVSFVGWGRWIATLLGVRERAHAGLLLVWGYAAVLAAGGWLCWLELAERDVLAALVGLGMSGFLLRKRSAPAIASDSAPLDRRAIVLRAGLALFCIGLLGLSYGSACSTRATRGETIAPPTSCMPRRFSRPDALRALQLPAHRELRGAELPPGAAAGRRPDRAPEPARQGRLPGGGRNRLARLLARGSEPISARGTHRRLRGGRLLRLRHEHRQLLLGRARLRGSLDDARRVPAWAREPGRERHPDRARGGGDAPAATELRARLCARRALRACEPSSRAHGRYDWKELPDRGRIRGALRGRLGAASAPSCGTALFPLLGGFANPEWNGLSAQDVAEFLDCARNFLDYPFASAPVWLCGLALCLPVARRTKRACDSRPRRVWSRSPPTPGCWRTPIRTRSPATRRRSWCRPSCSRLPTRLRSSDAYEAQRVCGFAPLALRRVPARVALVPPAHEPAPERALWLREELQGRVEAAPDNARATERYERLQSAAPAGERLLVMVDRPYLLDLGATTSSPSTCPVVSPPPGLF